VLQCVASVLQCVASVLQCVASVLQCVFAQGETASESPFSCILCDCTIGRRVEEG